MTDLADDILEHFGTKGMKWGVRNERRRQAATQLVERKKNRMEKSKELRAKSYEAKKNFYKKGIDKAKNMQPETKRKVATGALIAAGVATTAVILKSKGSSVLSRHTFKDVEDSWEVLTEPWAG